MGSSARAWAGITVDGNALAFYRLCAGYSQVELAKAVGMHKHTIYLLERGKRKRTKPSTLRRIAAVCDCKVRDLLKGEYQDRGVEANVT